MIVASASLVLATASMPAMAPVVAPAVVASTSAATVLAAEVSTQDAMPTAKTGPVDAVLLVHLSRDPFVVRHADGTVEYRPHPFTSIKFGLVGDTLTVCDSTGEYLQSSENGRCVLASRGSDVSGKVAARHVAGSVYEVQYAGKRVSGPLRPREGATFDIDGVKVGVMLYPLSGAGATVD